LAQVDFAVSATSGRIPLRVEFRDRSKGEIAAYTWDFGDGGTSDEKNPVHVYRKAGTYTPRLSVKNTVGAESRSPGGAVIEVREPLPWWIKLSVALLAAFLLWVLVVVPFFLKPAMLPHKDVAVRGDSTQMLRYLVSRHGWNWLWPRSYVTLGPRPAEDIRTGAATSKAAAVARFRRAFGSRTYVLKALQENAVATIRIDKDLSGNEVRDPRPLAASRTTILQDGKQYEVGGKTFTWIQPSPGRRRP
jgi:PKD repeat protein